MNCREKGTAGEDLAVAYLENLGYRILNRNFTAGRFPEIDIVASREKCLCFIEVKTRHGTQCGLGREAVDRRKQRKIRLVAHLYMEREGFADDQEVRFDVLEITMVRGEARMVWIENAF